MTNSHFFSFRTFGFLIGSKNLGAGFLGIFVHCEKSHFERKQLKILTEFDLPHCLLPDFLLVV